MTQRLTRRDFISHTALAAGGLCLVGCDAAAQTTSIPFAHALTDPAVLHGSVNFQSGPDLIDGYLARPRAKGQYPMVLVIAGNTISEEYISNTVAMLAQNGFVGLAPNIYSLQKDSMSPAEKQQVFSTQITDERISRDIKAAITYLTRQTFTHDGPAGIMGFCFGGRCGLMYAASAKEIGAIVPFYGNLKTPPSANRKRDPLDVLAQLRAPIQGHYAKGDALISQEQLDRFEQEVHAHGTPIELFTYEAKHGFFAYTRTSYDANAAKLSWSRTIPFLSRHLRK
jgi:carboxymethylenebutenolidase